MVEGKLALPIVQFGAVGERQEHFQAHSSPLIGWGSVGRAQTFFPALSPHLFMMGEAQAPVGHQMEKKNLRS